MPLRLLNREELLLLLIGAFGFEPEVELPVLASFVCVPLRFMSLRFIFPDRLSRACPSPLLCMLELLELMSFLLLMSRFRFNREFALDLSVALSLPSSLSHKVLSLRTLPEQSGMIIAPPSLGIVFLSILILSSALSAACAPILKLTPSAKIAISKLFICILKFNKIIR